MSPVLSEAEFRSRLAAVMDRHAIARAAGLRIGRPLAVTVTGWRREPEPAGGAS